MDPPNGSPPTSTCRLRPGDIVVTQPNEWHWHGATTDRFMVHLAFTEGDTEWGDHLTDEEYPGES